MPRPLSGVKSALNHSCTAVKERNRTETSPVESTMVLGASPGEIPEMNTPEPPNRIAFESLVKRLNHELKKVHKEIDDFWTEEVKASLKLIKEKRAVLEASCSTLVEEESSLRSVVDDLRIKVNGLVCCSIYVPSLTPSLTGGRDFGHGEGDVL
uniref:Kinesin-like protein KIF3A n=1 Tax=Steinernema glaseri TaxID=37863 RepID=A0A1I7Z5S8_9BILA